MAYLALVCASIATLAGSRRALPDAAQSSVATQDGLVKDINGTGNMHPGVSDDAGAASDAFPKAHPIVERALEHMTGELHALKGQERNILQEHGRLAESVDETTERMGDIPHLRSDISHREADVRNEERRLRRLQTEEARLQKSHAGLSSRLHAVLEPKIESAEQHLKDQRTQLDTADKQVVDWKGKLDESRNVALAKLQDKRHNLELLHEAETALALAQRRQAEAQEAYDTSKTTLDKDVEVYRYVQTGYEGVLSKERNRAEKARAQERSVKHLRGVLKMESKRISESLAAGEGRIQGRIRHAQGRLLAAKQKLAFQKEHYKNWRAAEKKRIQETAVRKADFEAAATAYAAQRRSVYESAEAKASQRAEKAGDWAWGDDWAWKKGGNEDVDGPQPDIEE